MSLLRSQNPTRAAAMMPSTAKTPCQVISSGPMRTMLGSRSMTIVSGISSDRKVGRAGEAREGDVLRQQPEAVVDGKRDLLTCQRVAQRRVELALARAGIGH